VKWPDFELCLDTDRNSIPSLISRQSWIDCDILSYADPTLTVRHKPSVDVLTSAKLLTVKER
jgi:hypothetical protein